MWLRTVAPAIPGMVPMLDDRVHRALSALQNADVGARLRKPLPAPDPTAWSCEVDLWLPSATLRRADRALEAEGFRRFRAPGHGSHRFYLALEDGRWIKLDAKVGDPGQQHEPRRVMRGARPGRLAGMLGRRRPLARRRQGPVVALLGPDGAGKGTVIAGLEGAIPVATRTIYFGLPLRRRPDAGPSPEPAPGDGPTAPGPEAAGPEAAGPETAGPETAGPEAAGPEAAGPTASGPRGWRRRLEALLVLKGLLWHARTLMRAYLAAWQGRIVLCDRHPIEVLAIDPRHTRLARSLERRIVRSLLPWPDRIIVLDAPAATMFARKGEHTVERLERWRVGFRSALGGPNTEVVDTAGTEEAAVRAASEVVWDALAERRRW
jgi:hypothetical protein